MPLPDDSVDKPDWDWPMLLKDTLERALVCNARDPVERQLSEWVWCRWTQTKLDSLKARVNALPFWYKDIIDKKDILPREKWLTEYAKYGYESNLEAVDISVVEKIMEEHGGEEVVQLADPEYRAFAQPIYEEIVREDNPTEMQVIFDKMLPRMREFHAGRTDTD